MEIMPSADGNPTAFIEAQMGQIISSGILGFGVGRDIQNRGADWRIADYFLSTALRSLSIASFT